MRASFAVLPLSFLATLNPSSLLIAHAQTIPANTAIEIRLDQTISSMDAKLNQRVKAELATDVIVKGKILLPKGAKAAVYVDKVQPGGDSAKPASLWLRLDAIAAHGRAYPVFARLAGEQLKSAVISSADPLGAPDGISVPPLEVTYASATVLNFQLKSPVRLH